MPRPGEPAARGKSAGIVPSPRQAARAVARYGTHPGTPAYHEPRRGLPSAPPPPCSSPASVPSCRPSRSSPSPTPSAARAGWPSAPRSAWTTPPTPTRTCGASGRGSSRCSSACGSGSPWASPPAPRISPSIERPASSSSSTSRSAAPRRSRAPPTATPTSCVTMRACTPCPAFRRRRPRTSSPARSRCGGRAITSPRRSSAGRRRWCASAPKCGSPSSPTTCAATCAPCTRAWTRQRRSSSAPPAPGKSGWPPPSASRATSRSTPARSASRAPPPRASTRSTWRRWPRRSSSRSSSGTERARSPAPSPTSQAG